MGYFWIRITIGLYGVLTGSVFGIVFSALNYDNFFYDQQTDSIILFIILMSIGMGCLFGVVLLTMPRVGYANIGMWVGVILSLLLQNSLLFLTGSLLGFYITLGVSCFLMVAISLLRFRKFIIVSTAFTSAFWLIRSLGIVLPHYPSEFTIHRLSGLGLNTPWQFYLYLICIVVLAILGSIVQFCWYLKRGRDQNNNYYLENDNSLGDKIKNLLEFQEIKDVFQAGKKQVMMFKNIVADNSDL